MKKKLTILFTVLVCVCSATAAQANAYIRGSTAPWNETTNEAAMDLVFGAGNWDDLRMADGAGPFSPGTHRFIYLEGGDDTAVELAAFLADNKAAIESFVSSGGTLLLNSAPNEGGNIDYGFGGVMLTYPSFAADVVAANNGHPVFNGPFTPVTNTLSGNFFGHAIVGGGVSPIIIGATGDPSEGETILGEMAFGSGRVLFGGMTTDNFHSPQPAAANLRANIINYVANSRPRPSIPVPTLGTWGLAIMTALMLLVGFGVRRRMTQI